MQATALGVSVAGLTSQTGLHFSSGRSRTGFLHRFGGRLGTAQMEPTRITSTSTSMLQPLSGRNRVRLLSASSEIDWDNKINRAVDRLEPYKELLGLPTPLVYSRFLSEVLDFNADCYLKLENFTKTKSFKCRGALHFLLHALEQGISFERAVAVSAGNHSQGVALAATLLGKKSLIVMPEGTDVEKVARTEAFGAEVILHGSSLAEAAELAEKLASEPGELFVHPFDEEEVLAGQATVGREILEALPDVDKIVAPIGGGGLFGGLCAAVPESVEVIGVQTKAMPSFYNSMRESQIEEVPAKKTIAAGIAVSRPTGLAVDLALKRKTPVHTVSEPQIKQAVKQLFEESCLKVEGAGAVGVAALLAGKLDPVVSPEVTRIDSDVAAQSNSMRNADDSNEVKRTKIVFVVSGGNIGPDMFSECLT